MSDSLEVLQTLAAQLDEGLILSDDNGHIRLHNVLACEMLGVAPDVQLNNLRELGHVHLARNAVRAAIEQGELDAAGRPSGRFVHFIERLRIGGEWRTLQFRSGLVYTDGRRPDRLRLTLIQDQTDALEQAEAARPPQDQALLTRDEGVQAVLERLRQVAPSQAAVLIQGESGTGKTQLARLIHQRSHRTDGPFVEVNCAAIPETLLESELFGHVKGAFTGASRSRKGRFALAHKGTLFLDEISEIPLHLQAKLLRALQDQVFEPVGADESVQVDIRVVAASNQDLKVLVQRGDFRADLFYRLAVIPMAVPPLRDRPADLRLLAEHFAARMAARHGRGPVRIAPDTLRALRAYPWPGNVRELENAIEHGVICAQDGVMLPASLPPDVVDQGGQGDDHPVSPPLASRAQRDERAALTDALTAAGWNRQLAAARLGINRTTLWRRMRRLGIAMPDGDPAEAG